MTEKNLKFDWEWCALKDNYRYVKLLCNNLPQPYEIHPFGNLFVLIRDISDIRMRQVYRQIDESEDLSKLKSNAEDDFIKEYS